MRQIVWLAGCLLVLSCTVNNDNLNTDAGGGTGGTGGTTGTGGVTASGGAGGCPRCAGTGGSSATGGQLGTGGALATGGQVGTGGQSGGGGQPGTGGSPSGGHGGKGAGGSGTGGNGGQSCDALDSDYNSALTAAMKCTLGGANQCQQLVNRSLSCPGCKQYVNDTTTLTALQTEWDARGCSAAPRVCPAIACLIPTASVCTSNPTGGGPGPSAGTSGTCANAQLTPAN
jgi:hypothetical protein